MATEPKLHVEFYRSREAAQISDQIRLVLEAFEGDPVLDVKLAKVGGTVRQVLAELRSARRDAVDLAADLREAEDADRASYDAAVTCGRR